MCFCLAARSTKLCTRPFCADGDQRPDIVLVVIGQIVLELLDGAREVGDQIVVDLLAGIDAAGGGAILAGVVVAERLDACDHRGDIGVVEHDHRRLAAELEMRALDRGGRGLQHLPAGIDAAGQRHHGDLRMIDQRVPGRGAAAGDDIHHAFGENLGDDLGELQRRQRRLLGRLDDDGIAAGQEPARASRRPSSSG